MLLRAHTILGWSLFLSGHVRLGHGTNWVADFTIERFVKLVCFRDVLSSRSWTEIPAFSDAVTDGIRHNNAEIRNSIMCDHLCPFSASGERT